MGVGRGVWNLGISLRATVVVDNHKQYYGTVQ